MNLPSPLVFCPGLSESLEIIYISFGSYSSLQDSVKVVSVGYDTLSKILSHFLVCTFE